VFVIDFEAADDQAASGVEQLLPCQADGFGDVGVAGVKQ
jgi:hypothetical protein